MLLMVVLFLFLSISVVMGISNPILRQANITNDFLTSRKSYFLSEAGIEDAVYRTKNNKHISGTEDLTLDGVTVTTSIVDNSGTKTIDTSASGNNLIRKVETVLKAGTGASFSYGMQTGTGGISMSGSGKVVGNVYSNGPIMGDSSAIITGTAISANSPALAADQTNGSGVPTNNVIFGNANGTQDIAQSFQVSIESPLNKVSFYIKKVSTPSDATVKIMNDAGGSPGATVLASGTLSATSVTTSYGWVDVSLTSNPILDTGTTYWLVIDGITSSTKYYTIGATTGGYANGVGKIGQMGGTWNATTPAGLDYYFKLYLGGVTGLIAGSSGSQYNQLHVGTVSGTAQAHTVNYTNATGNIYCQFGTGNNKSCTAQTDPVYVAYPVSDSNITNWQSEASAGGVYNGNYTVGSSGATLGPKKIVGDLTVSNGGVLVVSGTLWVTGNINLSGGGTIQLASSYGANDGVLIADGDVSISGGGHATGSGTTGSYIMMISNSSSASAMSVSGGAGAVIVYAPNGTVNISGGASLKEAVGYKMNISGGSTVTYESGLVDMTFSSGPTGGWSIKSWAETE